MGALSRSLVLAGLCVVIASAGAGAQTAPDPLAIPGRVLMCRVTKGDSGTALLRMFDPDNGKGREIRAAFDSAGKPLLIEVEAQEQQPGKRGLMRLFLAEFDSGGQRVRSIAEQDSVAAAAGTARAPKLEAMSDSEVRRARALAEWVWGRRCW